MPQYAHALEAMRQLLTKVGDHHWAEWIARDILEWREFNRVKHHLSAYGGMGSFNDVAPFDPKVAGPWADSLFSDLQRVCYLLATNHGKDLDEAALLASFAPSRELVGWCCGACEFAHTTVEATESVLEEWRMPRLVTRAVVAGTIGELVGSILAGRIPTVDEDRRILLALCQRANVPVMRSGGVMRGCPRCGSPKVGLISWRTDGELTLADDRPRNERPR